MKSARVRQFGTRTALVMAAAIAAATMSATASENRLGWLILKNGPLVVRINADLTLHVDQGKGMPAWETAPSSRPTIVVRPEKAAAKQPPLRIPLANATDRTATDFDDGSHQGQRIRLRALPGTDAEVELVLALDDRGELMVQIAQAGGKDSIQSVAGVYDWAVKPAADAYVVVPRGSGYIIRSDSPKPVALSGLIGAAYSLPMFGIIRGGGTCYQIIETWWDAQVSIQHTPGRGTAMSLGWEASLGKLSYPRRVLFRFAEKLDHVGMAKAYRQYLIERNQFTTLRQRAEKTPVLKDFLAGMEYRWVAWEPAEYAQVLENIRQFKKAGLPVTLFFPKWPAQPGKLGQPMSAANAGWQGYLLPQPVPGGWPAATRLADGARQLGCPVKLMVSPYLYFRDAPAYDPAKASNVGFPAISDRYAEEALTLILDRLQQKGFRFDALYFDAYSAYSGHPEHKDARGPVSRRQIYELQTACFRLTSRRGIVPGAELARFWSVSDCDFFFFTDWSSDRLREGEPIPFFPLVFHDCYGAYFSGGGYYEEGKYDWYADRHPRLYELMYAAMPSHNWLPGGSRAIRPEDWGTEAMNRRLAWLRRWHQYYQKVCYSEMLTHKFLNPEHTLQRVEFAGGVSADFDLAKGLYRVRGVPGFSGDWQRPEEITR
jgi:hypothetical protein